MKIELEEVLNELVQYMLFGHENADDVYEKEEIIQLDSKTNDINQIYKKFKKIEEDNYWRMSEEEVFYRQAKYVENFEDSYIPSQIHRDSYDPFSSYYNYSEFSFSDFRTYPFRNSAPHLRSLYNSYTVLWHIGHVSSASERKMSPKVIFPSVCE